MDLDAILAEVLNPLGVELGDDASDYEQSSQAEIEDESTCTMFQTSREHYGVFYRLDLVGGIPELRVFTPGDQPPLRMMGFRVRPSPDSDLPNWFRRLNDTPMVGDTGAANNHVLFACGEILKNLFWSGSWELMSFPHGVSITRLF